MHWKCDQNTFYVFFAGHNWDWAIAHKVIIQAIDFLLSLVSLPNGCCVHEHLSSGACILFGERNSTAPWRIFFPLPVSAGLIFARILKLPSFATSECSCSASFLSPSHLCIGGKISQATHSAQPCWASFQEVVLVFFFFFSNLILSCAFLLVFPVQLTREWRYSYLLGFMLLYLISCGSLKKNIEKFNLGMWWI